MKKKQEQLVWGRKNYLLLATGALILVIGYILMSGGRSPDPNVFNPDEIYSFRRITLAPIMLVLGYLTVIYAIFKR